MSTLRCCLVVALTLVATTVVPVAGAPASRTDIGATNARVPYLFVENAGQFDPAVRFAAPGLWLTDTAIWLDAPASAAASAVDLRISFVGANASARPEAIGARAGQVSFLLGSDPSLWRTGLAAWSGVVYRDLYPGVDLEIGAAAAGLAWRWVTRAGQPPPDALQIEGGVIAGHGDDGVRIETAAGDVTLALPSTSELSAATLGYSTLLGASGRDVLRAIAVDASGAAHVAGGTTSWNFPTTPGVRDPEMNGESDIIVAKFNAAGSGLSYATYLGGEGDDVASGIAVDSSGAVHLVGSTTSVKFPTRPSSLFPHVFGGEDAVVAVLNADGSALLASTYLGGGGTDTGAALALDGAGNVVVVGTTTSSNFVTTGLQTSRNGESDAFVASFTPGLTSLRFATYLGGATDETGTGVAVDGAGSVYVVGATSSSDFPVTPGVVQSTLAGDNDAFVTKLSALGVRTYGTYLGGNKDEVATAIAVDTRGAAYIAGAATSNDFPVSSLAVQPSPGGGAQDAFVTMLNTAASYRVYSTYLGGSGDDSAAAITVDASGAATIVGQTTSSNFLVSGDADQRSRAGGVDGFVTRLAPAGLGSFYSSYLGGEADDYGRAVAQSKSGAVFVAGSTGSLAFPTTPGAYQRHNRGSSEGFVTQLALGGGPANGPPYTIVEDGHVGVGSPALQTTWYFAEGYTAAGFDEYITIFNPNAVTDATISYYVEGQPAPTTRTLTLGAATRTIVRVHGTVSAGNPAGLGRLSVGHGTKVQANTPVVAERLMVFERENLAGSHIGLGATAPAMAWYFAEGYTGAGFDTYLTILNPNATPAPVTVDYYLGNGTTKTVTLTAPPNGRSTIAVHDATQGVGRGQAVSARVRTSLASGIIVERPMYFGYDLSGVSGARNAGGGHTILGATAPALSWSFAEGWTGSGFDEYLTILNPNSAAANLTITYFLPDGTTTVKSLSGPANTRLTVTVHDDSANSAGVGRNKAVSARVESTNGVSIVVERPMYFRYTPSDGGDPISGGHAVRGALAASTTWYLAEGATLSGTDEYLTLQNATATAGTATVRYYVDGLAPISRNVPLPANSRTTIVVHADGSTGNPGGLGRHTAGHATVVESTVPIVVERPMYARHSTNFS